MKQHKKICTCKLLKHSLYCFPSVSGALETIRIRIPVICRGLAGHCTGTPLPPQPPTLPPPPPYPSPQPGPIPDITVVLVRCVPSFVVAKKTLLVHTLKS